MTIHQMSFCKIVSTLGLLLFQGTTTAFVAPRPFHQSTPANSRIIACQAIPNTVPLASLTTPSFLVSAETENLPVGLDDAFTDEIVLIDPTIKILLAGFGVFVILALAAKFFLNKMDDAIEKVLVEFENTMKSKYQSRWVSIETKLDGLVEPERSQRLFVLMEELQQSEPEFMAQVNRDMSSM